MPYLREVQDCLHPDHPSRRVVARWAAQLGKTTAMENWFAFVVDQAPGPMMVVFPTLDEATKFNRVKLQTMIDASKRLKHKVKPVSSRDESGSTISFKRFAGGFCQIVNAGSSKGLQMLSIKYLAMDEVTGYANDVDGRGSPRDQARARQKQYGDMAKEFQCSTPGDVGYCVVTADFLAGDQRYYYVPCPHCSVFQVLTFEQMRGPAHAIGLDAHLRCLSCDGAIVDGHKTDMLAGGKWIARRVDDGETAPGLFLKAEEIAKFECPPCEGRCRDWQPSYHLWAAYSKNERFDDIWKGWMDAQGDTSKIRTFSQQTLAEPYDPGVDAVDWEKIVDMARGFAGPVREVPREAGLLVSAADVQGYGIKWAVYAIGPRSQRWLIDREIFEGPPDKVDDAWIALADALERKYPAAGGTLKGLDLSGVDTGFATQRAYRFCAARPQVMALDGRHVQKTSWIGTPTVQKIKDQFGRVIAKTALYPVHLYDVKTEVVASLANFVDGPAANGWPRNVLHLSGDLVDEDFAKELTAERLVDPDEEVRSSVNRRARNLVSPKAKREWKKVGGRQNDWFDVTVYAFALGWYLETKRHLTAEKWADLLVEVHGRQNTPDLFDAPDVMTPAKTTAPTKRERRPWGAYKRT